MANKITLSRGQVFKVLLASGVEIEIDCDDGVPPKAPGDITFNEGPGVRFFVSPQVASSLQLESLIGAPDEIRSHQGPQIQVVVPRDVALALDDPALQAVLHADADVSVRMGSNT